MTQINEGGELIDFPTSRTTENYRSTSKTFSRDTTKSTNDATSKDTTYYFTQQRNTLKPFPYNTLKSTDYSVSTSYVGDVQTSRDTDYTTEWAVTRTTDLGLRNTTYLTDFYDDEPGAPPLQRSTNRSTRIRRSTAGYIVTRLTDKPTGFSANTNYQDTYFTNWVTQRDTQSGYRNTWRDTTDGEGYTFPTNYLTQEYRDTNKPTSRPTSELTTRDTDYISYSTRITSRSTVNTIAVSTFFDTGKNTVYYTEFVRSTTRTTQNIDPNQGSAGGYGLEIYDIQGRTVLRSDELLIRKIKTITLDANGEGTTTVELQDTNSEIFGSGVGSGNADQGVVVDYTLVNSTATVTVTAPGYTAADLYVVK
jgi:hypothetical protein